MCELRVNLGECHEYIDYVGGWRHFTTTATAAAGWFDAHQIYHIMIWYSLLVCHCANTAQNETIKNTVILLQMTAFDFDLVKLKQAGTQTHTRSAPHHTRNNVK